jgi:hypothetical protein
MGQVQEASHKRGYMSDNSQLQVAGLQLCRFGSISGLDTRLWGSEREAFLDRPVEIMPRAEA